MLNGYRKPYEWPATDRFQRAVPSTRFLSIITKDNQVTLFSASAALLSTSILNIALLDIHTLETILLITAWTYFVYMWISYIGGYKMEGSVYNKHLWEIEKAFNEMSKANRKKYAKLLDNAYKTCTLNKPDETELAKIKELFELSKDNEHDLLDNELEIRRAMKKIETESEQELDNQPRFKL